MISVFLETLPFFALIGLGYFAGVSGFFSEAATAHLTKFVFYFALSAMLFRFSATLSIGEILDWNFVLVYLIGSAAVWLIALIIGLLRGSGWAEASIEAQCAIIGNVGFLGIPMLVLLLGPEAIGPNMLVLAVDLIVFGSLVVIFVTAAKDGRMSPCILGTIAMGLLKNPMIVSICLGLLWATLEIPLPAPFEAFVSTLGAAATPCALFAIGASLASKSAERLSVAGWLSFCKLILHPLAIVLAIIYLPFPIDPYAAGVMIACAALPVAGNIYIVAQHYGVAPQRVSASILVSTSLSVLTVSAVIAWVKGF
ncbi:MAG: AEC family transporter [Pseudomonadota bacterium]